MSDGLTFRPATAWDWATWCAPVDCLPGLAATLKRGGAVGDTIWAVLSGEVLCAIVACLPRAPGVIELTLARDARLDARKDLAGAFFWLVRRSLLPVAQAYGWHRLESVIRADDVRALRFNLALGLRADGLAQGYFDWGRVDGLRLSRLIQLDMGGAEVRDGQ